MRRFLATVWRVGVTAMNTIAGGTVDVGVVRNASKVYWAVAGHIVRA